MDAPARTTGLTYADLETLPDDGNRYELIDGELHVTPAPSRRHQQVVLNVLQLLLAYRDAHGGELYPAPTDVHFAPPSVVEPDALYVVQDRVSQLRDPRYVDIAPDLAVEVGSPSSEERDRGPKRDLYEREGVAEYWFVDPEAQIVEVHRLTGSRYGLPESYGRGEQFHSTALPGLHVAVDDVLRSPAA